MVHNVLFMTYSALLLILGSLLSYAFANIELNKKNLIAITLLIVCSGIFQILLLFPIGEVFIWKAYPLITHLPIVLLITFYFKKSVWSAIVATASAYLCCQPAKWCGILVYNFINSEIIQLVVQIVILVIFVIYILYQISASIASIYARDTRTVIIFGLVPIIYYVYDYFVNVYLDTHLLNSQITTEFLPFFLCISFLSFCVIYYKEYEQKMHIKQQHDMIHLNIQQHEKELSTLKRIDNEMSIIRHDLRLLLSNLALCIEQDDKENALKMIDSYTKRISAATIHRYCENTVVNYVLNNYKAQCDELGIKFITSIIIGKHIPDETLLSILLSNALDNAINAQKDLQQNQRKIHLLMKVVNNKLLIQIKNPFKKVPTFENGVPVNYEQNHGYGIQSICHITEQLHGNYHFSTEDNTFIIQIII